MRNQGPEVRMPSVRAAETQHAFGTAQGDCAQHLVITRKGKEFVEGCMFVDSVASVSSL